jgi:hypothetical protein
MSGDGPDPKNRPSFLDPLCKGGIMPPFLKYNEVVPFAELMHANLVNNDHKGHWECTTPQYLSRKLTEEFSEVQTELARILKVDPSAQFYDIRETHLKRIRKEAIDLACICLMIADRCEPLLRGCKHD